MINKLLKKFNIKIKRFNQSFLIDNKKIVNYILNSKNFYFVYSGYQGYIIRNINLLSKKKILHAHPGRLPDTKEAQQYSIQF